MRLCYEQRDLLFVMLYSMFYFMMNGGTSLRKALRYTPLSEEDSIRLLATSAGSA